MAKPYHPIVSCSISLCVYLAGATPLDAAEAWRCGNTYTDQPCAGGKAIHPDDSRSPIQARDAEAATRRNQAAADRMERDRRRQETLGSRQQPVVIGARPQAAAELETKGAPSASKKKRKGINEPEFFTAHGQQAQTTRKKKRAQPPAD